MVTCQINDKSISVAEGTSIIDAADANDIYIPRFCYHKKLTIVANCRMCLIEITGVRKPLPACATLISEGMKIYTQSKLALDAQRAVMEFLLINHPLDCPICDQGGQCELQDLSMGFGVADSQYGMVKRSVESLNLGPLIATDMTRCIHCTRCIRVSDEICGVAEMGATYRGEDTEIGTYIAQTIRSELSCNMTDVCPVGALTTKPDAAKSRPWELYESPAIAIHDCWGSHTYAQTKAHEYTKQKTVFRIVPRECEAINESWLADRDRFSCESYYCKSRMSKPLVKRNGKWLETNLEAALLESMDKLVAINNQQGADRIAGILSPNATLEEAYIFRKWFHAMGVNNVDHRIRVRDSQLRSIHIPDVAANDTDIEESDAILLIGSNLRQEVPMANFKVLKAFQNDSKIMAINSESYDFNYRLTKEVICPSHALANSVLELMSGLNDRKHHIGNSDLNDVVDYLIAAEKKVIILGHDWYQHSDASNILSLVYELAQKHNIKVVLLSDGANSLGLSQLKTFPENNNLTANQLLNHVNIDALVMLNLEPELDCITDINVQSSLEKMPLVICMTPFLSDAMLDYADIIIPIAMPFEQTGSWINAQQKIQSIGAVSIPPKNIVPAYKILLSMARLMSFDGFDFESSNDVLAVVKDELSTLKNHMVRHSDLQKVSEHDLSIKLYWPALRVDAQLRRAESLQKIYGLNNSPSHEVCLQVNPITAEQLMINDGQMVKIIGCDDQQYKVKFNAKLAVSTLSIKMGDQSVVLPTSCEKLQIINLGERNA